MSASTPNPDAEHHASRSDSRLPAGAISPRWWLASIGFHAVLVVGLLFFSPTRVIDPAAKPTAVNGVRGSRARKVVEQIRQKQAASMGENLRALEAIRRKLADLENQKRSEFLSYAGEMGQDAPAKATADQQGILALQADIMTTLHGASSNCVLFVMTRANAFYDDMSDAQKAIREKQNRVLQLQDQVQALLSLGDSRYTNALAAQTEAASLQDRASKVLIEVDAAQDPSRNSRHRIAREREIEHYTFHLKRNQEEVINTETNRVIAQKELAVARAVVDRRKAALEKASAQAAIQNNSTNKVFLDAAQTALTRAEKDLVSAQRRVDDAPKRVLDAQKQLPALTNKVSELMAEAPLMAIAPTTDDQKLMDLLEAALKLQAEALESQIRAAQAVGVPQGVKNATNAVNYALEELDKVAPIEPGLSSADFSRMNLAQMYGWAVKTESALAHSYRRLRALELAMIRRVSLAKSIQLTDVAKAMRPDLSTALLSSVSSGHEALAAREAVQTAKAEVSAMVRLAGSLLSQAQGLDKRMGTTISTADFNRQFEQWQTMEAMAAEDEVQWARDLTAMMGGDQEGGEGDGLGEGGEDPGGLGGGTSGGNGGSGGGGFGGFGKGGGRSGNTGAGEGTGDLPNLGNSGIAGPFGPGGFGQGGIPGARGSDAAPENVSQRLFPFPGRRITSRGTSAQWLYVDSWYILGPFDNTGRRNIDKKFPPETVIDLNATYPGKNGIPIRWEYYQSGRPNVMPPLDGYNSAAQNPMISPAESYRQSLEYIIYYAYSELWFEEACDLWVAIGSDDFSKLWIEDQLIWSSGKRLKAWQMNEGLRKVRFKKGINRVLYRVENGNNITEFSLVISFQH